MNICFFSETAAWGGAEVHTVGLAETLVERGHTVRIVALGHDVFDEIGRRPETRFTVQRIALAKPVHEMSWAECKALMRGLPDEVGVLVRFGIDLGGVRLDLAARRHFRRYLAIEHSAAVLPPLTRRWHCRGLVPGLGLWWYQSRLLWWLRSVLPHRVVCVSNGARQVMIQQFRVPASKLVSIYNGIDAEKFQPSQENRFAARRAWNVPENAFVFGSVGRLHVEKGLDLAIEAFSQLVTRYPGRDLRLVLAGDGPAKSALCQAARDAGVAKRVVFAGFTASPWETYPGLDAFVMPTHEEALGLALMEAMACGCCAIAMGVGGIPEVLSDPATGWLIPPRDRAAFLEAMDTVLCADDARRTAVGRAAREHIVAHFDARRQFAALADLIEQCGAVAPRATKIDLPSRSLESCI